MSVGSGAAAHAASSAGREQAGGAARGRRVGRVRAWCARASSFRRHCCTTGGLRVGRRGGRHRGASMLGQRQTSP
eukprot:5588532-Pleurochrysis_carterae.AAC.1